MVQYCEFVHIYIHTIIYLFIFFFFPQVTLYKPTCIRVLNHCHLRPQHGIMSSHPPPSTNPKLMYASITDEVFNNPKTCLLVNQNSISYRNFGRCASIVEKYFYADVAGLRQPCPHLKYCCTPEFRDIEGNVVIKSPPLYRNGPVVATLITQYGIGSPLEDNKIAKDIIENAPDTAIRTRLKEDTEKNRVSYFNRAVYKLKVQLERDEFKDVKKVVFPIGIARGGNADNVWLTQYLPIINCFSNDMARLNKDVVLLVNETYMNILSRLFINRSDYVASCFHNLKNLDVINVCDFDKSVDYNLSFDNEDVPDSLREYIISYPVMD